MESTKIDADAEELMERIRRQTSAGGGDAQPQPIDDFDFAPLPPIPSTKHLIPKPLRTEKLFGLVESAREKTEAGGGVPKFLRSLFRKQGSFNRLVLESLTLLMKTIVELHNRVGAIATHLDGQARWSESLHDQMQRVRIMVTTTSERLQHMEERIDGINAHLEQRQSTTAKRLQHTEERIDGINAHLEQRHDLLQSTLERRLDVLGGDLATAGTHIRELQTRSELAQLSARAGITQLERDVDQLRRNADALQVAASRVDERQLADSSYFKAQLSIFTQLLRRQGEGNAPAPAAAGEPPKIAATDLDSRLADTFYVAFENAFRGERADIKRRQEIYLPYVTSVNGRRSSLPVLDLGCGRGEWLELLRDNELIARGVDLNREMVDYCNARGLEAMHGDALQYLKAQPDGAFAAVTAFHLIEHLPFAVLMELLREALRVLETGGSLICETPNPANIQVGAHFFYRDPTHQRPLPSDSTRFLALHVGFREVEIVPVNPCTPEAGIAADHHDLAEQFKQLFYGPQDYAIVGAK